MPTATKVRPVFSVRDLDEALAYQTPRLHRRLDVG
jgi:hypothetical protein